MEPTPIAEAAPRILVHVRGRLDRGHARFWVDLRHALRSRGFELFLTAHCWPDSMEDVPVLRAPNGLAQASTLPPEQGWDAWLPSSPPLDPAPYLARETLWNGAPANPGDAARRLRATNFFQRFYGAALQQTKPVFSLIWNGHHPQEMILRDLCRSAGCPVHYLERAPLHGAIQVDPEDILAGTAIARSTDWHWEDVKEQARWHGIAADAAAANAASGSTWWEQPQPQDAARLRRKLGIRAGQQVVLFAGQVDRDTQNLLYSPHFSDCLEALKAFCAQLPDDGSVFVLGKHHPKSDVDARTYAAVLGNRGVWTSDVSLDDALALADRVAAVNSTVLFEALMREKPVLMLGESLLSGKGIAYELNHPDEAGDTVQAWLSAQDAAARHERWQDYLAYLMAHCFYSMQPDEGRGAQHGADALAGYIAKHAVDPSAVDYGRLPGCDGMLDMAGHWQDAARKGASHTGFKEVLRGLNIIVHEVVGKRMPRFYAWGLKRANRIYERINRLRK